jgi:hypothetical protein
MVSSFSSFKHSPFRPASLENGEFRLLTLHPGQKRSRICIDLRHASIEDPPMYEALSYTWGDPKGPWSEIPDSWRVKYSYNIEINGQKMKIGFNLKSALRRIRDRTEFKRLWVDAICINQNNQNERSEQVKEMARIYRQAARVLCWLGEEDRFVKLAFDTLEELCWAVKIQLWGYCCVKLEVPLSHLSDSIVDSVIDSELESSIPGSPVHPFQKLLDTYRCGAFKRAISQIPIQFALEQLLEELAITTFGKSRNLARDLLLGSEDVSKLPGFKDRIKAIQQVLDLERIGNESGLCKSLLLQIERSYFVANGRSTSTLPLS